VGNLTQIPPISCLQLEYYSVLDLDIVLVTKHNIANHLQIMESEPHLYDDIGVLLQTFYSLLACSTKTFLWAASFFKIGQPKKTLRVVLRYRPGQL
jgi:hypothetical protein